MFALNFPNFVTAANLRSALVFRAVPVLLGAIGLVAAIVGPPPRTDTAASLIGAVPAGEALLTN